MMRTEHRIDAARGVLYWKASGSFTLQELLEALSEVMDHPDYRPDMKSLNDLREITLPFSTPEVQTVADLLKKSSSLIGEGKVAVVLTHDAAYGMGRAFQVYAESCSAEIQIFRDMQAACDWLGIEPPASQE
jgi:hypothetical protein